MEDENAKIVQQQLQHQYQYGTFQGVANYYYPNPPPPHPVVGFPQPVPPPLSFALNNNIPTPPAYFNNGYQTLSPGTYNHGGEGSNVGEGRLPCCGMGMGWFLFIIGFFLGGIPWYLGSFIMLTSPRLHFREKPGYLACIIASILSIMAVTLGLTKGKHHHW